MLVAVRQSEGSPEWSKVEDLDQLSDFREEGHTLLYAETDVADLTEDDVRLITEEFDLHRLAVEDAGKPRQRPKLEVYDTHLFLVVQQLDEEEGQLEPVQIACFIGDNYVLTMHSGAQRTLDDARRRWQESGKDVHHPFRLLHVLMDVVVDDYQAIADRVENEIEDLEDIVLATQNDRSRKHERSLQRQLYSVKQRVSRLRRYVFPASRGVETLLENHIARKIPPDVVDDFQDVRDHLLRIKDQVVSVDDLTQAVIELLHTDQADALNQVNKKLSAWAAIFGIDTVIAGVYGMNFILVPQDQTLFGFWFAIALMVLSSIALYVNFKRRDWL